MSPDRKTIWYGSGLATIYDQLRIIRESDSEGRFRLLAGTLGNLTSLSTVADKLIPEPEGSVGDSEFIEWCRDVCRREGVDLFVPSRRVRAVSSARKSFEGVRVCVPATPEVLDLLEHKDRFYTAMPGIGIPSPRFRVFSTLDEFDAARNELAGIPLCIKPAVGIFASGYFKLDDSLTLYQQLTEGRSFALSTETFRSALVLAEKPKRYLLMEYLPGEERSVDCLCVEGRLVTGIGRVKKGNAQVSETKGPAVDIARRLVEHFSLNGIVNVQTRDNAGGETQILEVNARASGGLPFAVLAGTALPYWSAMLALGLARPEDVPEPRHGVKVAPVTHAVVLP